MRKTLFLMFLLLFMSGCSGGNKILDDAENKLRSLIPDEISEDIDLAGMQDQIGNDVFISWESDDSYYLTPEGKITQDEERHEVILTATIKYKNTARTIDIGVAVMPECDADTANSILNEIDIPPIWEKDFPLPSSVKYQNRRIEVTWKSSSSAVTNKGKITYANKDVPAVLTASITYMGNEYQKEFEITIKKFAEENLDDFFSGLNIPEETEKDLHLPQSATVFFRPAKLEWTSSNNDVITNTGKVKSTVNPQSATLTCKVSFDDVTVIKTYEVSVLPISDETLLDILTCDIKIPKLTSRNLYLKQDFEDASCTWKSSDESAMSSDGAINQDLKSAKEVSLTLTLRKGDKIMTKTYQTSVLPLPNIYQDELFEGKTKNLHRNEKGSLCLNKDALCGTFESYETEHEEFTEAVASWCALTTLSATCELFVSLKVGGTYSEYISYGKFGLGLKNKCCGQENSLIELADDEIKVLHQGYATGFKYKAMLERKSLEDKSPELSMVTLTFKLKDKEFDSHPDLSILKGSTYDVPKLYQHTVPSIGGIICSATSSTMLLKYKGHSFKDKDSLEHRYIAGIVKDYGNDIYGNWVYNCVGMSSFGEKAYVKRFYGITEFLQSIDCLGPVAASIRGTVEYETNNGRRGSYNTKGHLLVVTGYALEEGNVFILINDPNVREVSIKVTLANFLSFWRNVAYVIE